MNVGRMRTNLATVPMVQEGVADAEPGHQTYAALFHEPQMIYAASVQQVTYAAHVQFASYEPPITHVAPAIYGLSPADRTKRSYDSEKAVDGSPATDRGWTGNSSENAVEGFSPVDRTKMSYNSEKAADGFSATD